MKTHQRRILLFPIGLSMLASLGAHAASSATKPRNTPVETRSYISESCLLSDNDQMKQAGLGAALAGVLIPKAIDSIIDYTISELTKIRKNESTSINNFYLYKQEPSKKYPEWNASFGCITTITAKFDQRTPEGAVLSNFDYSSNVDLSQRSENKSNILRRLSDNKIIFEQNGLFSIYESKLEFSDDRSAFKMKSRYLQVDRLLNNKKSAGLVYTYELDGPGLTPDSTKYAMITIDFGKIETGDRLTLGNFIKGKETGLVKRIGMTKESILSFISNKSKPVQSKLYTPVKLTVKNTQIRKPSDGAKFVASILKASKETISASLSQSILPKDKEEIASSHLDAKIAVAEAKAAQENAVAGTAAQDLADLQHEKACIALKIFDEKGCN